MAQTMTRDDYEAATPKCDRRRVPRDGNGGVKVACDHPLSYKSDGRWFCSACDVVMPQSVIATRVLFSWSLAA